MSLANVTSEWVNGNLVFKNENTGATLFTFDAASGLLGNVTGQTFGTVTDYTTVTPAIALTNKMARLDATANAVAATLADSTNDGQIIYIKAINVDSAVTLVPASLTDGTTITFTPVNEYIILIWSGSSWDVIGGNAAIT